MTYTVPPATAAPPERLQGVADFAGGVLNAVTFGNEQRITKALGISDHVNRCSGAYALGEVAGIVAMTAIAVAGGEAYAAERGAMLESEGEAGALPTYRGEARPPSVIFEEGFQPQGSGMDLLAHAEGQPGSGFVSTSRSAAIASDFGPNVYEIRAPGGIDVNETLGMRTPFPGEQEIAYPGGIDSCYVVGCTLPSGQWVPNPGFIP